MASFNRNKQWVQTRTYRCIENKLVQVKLQCRRNSSIAFLWRIQRRNSRRLIWFASFNVHRFKKKEDLFAAPFSARTISFICCCCDAETRNQFNSTRILVELLYYFSFPWKGLTWILKEIQFQICFKIYQKLKGKILRSSDFFYWKI